MSALPELWAALLGWTDLVVGRGDAARRFNLSRTGLINAAGCFLAVVIAGLVLATAMGHGPGVIGAAIGLLLNALPLLAVWLVGVATNLALKPRHGAFGLMVPATYAMALVLLIRMPLEMLYPGVFANALLGVLGFLMFRAARGVSEMGVASALSYALLVAVALVLVTIGLYMVSTSGAGIG